MAKSYRELLVWGKAMDLAQALYILTRTWPGDERYGLTSQARRAAVSVPSNIAEGEGRGSDADFCRFLRIAHGSLCEVETQVMLACRLGYVGERDERSFIERADEVGRLINGLIRSLNSRPR